MSNQTANTQTTNFVPVQGRLSPFTRTTLFRSLGQQGYRFTPRLTPIWTG